ncbi:unnamed protein product [Chrysoparadoxa australica]
MDREQDWGYRQGQGSSIYQRERGGRDWDRDRGQGALRQRQAMPMPIHYPQDCRGPPPQDSCGYRGDMRHVVHGSLQDTRPRELHLRQSGDVGEQHRSPSARHQAEGLVQAASSASGAGATTTAKQPPSPSLGPRDAKLQAAQPAQPATEREKTHNGGPKGTSPSHGMTSNSAASSPGLKPAPMPPHGQRQQKEQKEQKVVVPKLLRRDPAAQRSPLLTPLAAPDSCRANPPMPPEAATATAQSGAQPEEGSSPGDEMQREADRLRAEASRLKTAADKAQATAKADRARARAEQRKTRGPRTHGWLFKYTGSGSERSTVNADDPNDTSLDNLKFANAIREVTGDKAEVEAQPEVDPATDSCSCSPDPLVIGGSSGKESFVPVPLSESAKAGGSKPDRSERGRRGGRGAKRGSRRGRGGGSTGGPGSSGRDKEPVPAPPPAPATSVDRGRSRRGGRGRASRGKGKGKGGGDSGAGQGYVGESPQGKLSV